jgi:hypothetical protein
MEHAWCRDPSRDERVRAAEDGRDRPLPTLGECIETSFSAGVRDSFRKVEEAWAMIPKSVSASSPVEPENKANGMRTERITLEVTHDWRDSPCDWDWDEMLRFKTNILADHESVRVVDDCCLDRINMGEIIRQRDAALRERDAHKEEYYKLRAARITQALTADRFASAVQEADTLKARVAALEAASGGGEGA